MKDYSFGDKEYQKTFIVNYKPTKDYSQFIVYYADGNIDYKQNTIANEREILETMANQINRAYDLLHNSSIDYSSVNLFEGIIRLATMKVPMKEVGQFISVKQKENDIEKNKLILDNEEYFKRITQRGNIGEWVMSLPLYLQDRLLYGIGGPDKINLTTADKFTRKETQIVFKTAKYHSDNFYDLPQSGDLERERVI